MNPNSTRHLPVFDSLKLIMSSLKSETICMIIPPSVFLLDERVFMSLGILKIAACLEKAGYTVDVLDTSGILNYDDVIADYLVNHKVKIVALTATTPQLPATVKIVERVRNIDSNIRIILGGPHVTLVSAAVKMEKKAGRISRAHRAMNKLESTFDVLVAGDGEMAIFEAIKENSSKLIDGDDPKNGMFMTDAFYDASPYPARHLVDIYSYKYTIDGHQATSLIAQLGCPFGCAFSITGDTLIFTENGFERVDSLLSSETTIENCVHGGSVHTYSINRRVSTITDNAIATTMVYEGTKQVYEVRTEYGIRIRGTAEHPFLALENGVPTWKEIRELKIGDWLIMQNPKHEWPSKYLQLNHNIVFPSIPPGGFARKDGIVPKFLNEDLGWLIGYLIGDGCLPSDHRPSVHLCVTDELKEKLLFLTYKLFNVELNINKASHTDEMEHGWIHSRIVYEFFTQTLEIDPLNKLHVPACILKSPKTVVEAFLRGLMDADGYLSNHTEEYLTTVSYELAKEISNIILMLGGNPHIQDVWVKKYNKFVYRVNKLRLDRIPTGKALYKSKKSKKWFWRTPRNPKGFLGVLRSTLKKSGLSHPLNIDGRYYVRVEAITQGLIEKIYDLRVPGDHCFNASGLIAHNCGGRNSKALRQIRTRTTNSIINEIDLLYTKYGYTGFMLYDDELNVSKNFVELCNAIADLQQQHNTEFRLRGFIKSELFTEEQADAMYRAGFRWILCGFEAANARILENINKHATIEDNTRVITIAKKYGLKTKALMSVGHAGENKRSIYDLQDWLLRVKPDDFDCTIITTFPGTPYYDEALENSESPGVYTFTCKKSGDRLHAYDVDFTQTAEYYKGDPDGGYHSYVYTDYLSAEQIVKLRDEVEMTVRKELNIPFNPGQAAVQYEHSMGQGNLPSFILKR